MIDPLDIGRFVKAVRVEHGKLIDGQPMTKLSCVIDTASLVDESFSGFGELSFFTGGAFTCPRPSGTRTSSSTSRT